MMEVTASAREHLFQTISQQYGPDDAETLKALLMPTTLDDLATKQDLAAFVTKQDLAEFRAEFRADFAELKTEFAEFKAEMRTDLHQQTRTYISWMFGLLTAYTAIAGSLVAIATIVTH